MIERHLVGRAWHGDHLIDAATPEEIGRLAAVEDGDDAGGGLVHRIDEFSSEVDGAVLLYGFEPFIARKAPRRDPLAHLRTGPRIDVPRSRPATVRIVSLVAPDGLDDAERMQREFSRGAGVGLVTVQWGEVASWVAAEPSLGAPATAVEMAFMLALAPAERVVPSVEAAREWLTGGAVAPGGERGQRLRENGHRWPSVPTVGSWEPETSADWVLAALLERASRVSSAERASFFGALAPRMTTLVPDGAPVLIAVAGSRISAASDRLLTLWHGKDGSGRTVGVALHRSAPAMPAMELPLWEGQRASDPPDGWLGEVLEHRDEDDPGYVSRSRLRVTPLGRLTLRSRRIVTSDPCAAGRSPALGLEVADVGPYLVLRADLLCVMDDGSELDEQSRGILLVLDEVHAPVRWEPARDADGHLIDCGIDSGQLLLGDAQGVNAVQRQYDEGTVDHGSQARLRLLRSDPGLPADIAVLADLGGDGPAWVVVGVAEDGHPVAVMVANFDPLS